MSRTTTGRLVVCWNEARAADARAAWERAAVHAQQAEDRHEYYEILTLDCVIPLVWTNTRDEGIRRCEAMRLAADGGSLSLKAAILRQLATLNAIVGNFTTARDLPLQATQYMPILA